MEAVQKKLDEGKLAEAQLALSTLYGNPDLPAEQAKQITDLLDQLAGTVIYSRQHYLEPAYVAQPGDTLDNIAQKYNIPWQLLARINGLMPPGAIAHRQPGKRSTASAGHGVESGARPVRRRRPSRQARTDADGPKPLRRPVSHRRRPRPAEARRRATRSATRCSTPPTTGPTASAISPNDPQNPLGSAWIGLTDRIGIHGTNDPQAIGRDDNRGAICVGDRDLQDLYGILSVGSRVTILR